MLKLKEKDERGVFFLSEQDRVYRYTMAVMLIVFIGIIFVLNIVLPDRAFSEEENRKLEQAPKFSRESLMKGKFTTKFEKYISDQFAFRDMWVGVKSDAEKAIGKKENNGVYMGKDGFLLQKFDAPSQKDVNKKIEDINAYASMGSGVKKYFMLVPNSIKILEDKLPADAPVSDQLKYIDEMKALLDKNINFVDVYDSLYSKRNEYIYFKTDHHWTANGAYYAYKKLGEDMGFTPHNKEYFNIKKVTDEFFGTLYSKSGFRHIGPDSIELYIPKSMEQCRVEYFEESRVADSLYSMDNLNKKDKYAVFFNGNHPFIKITTAVNKGKKLLIIKDSYANSLIPFLTGHYREIYVVDPRYYDEDMEKLVKDKNIDEILIVYNVNTFFGE